ncbi:MAG: hypothetical protein R3C32_06805 [Chloroflexota bacterium]
MLLRGDAPIDAVRVRVAGVSDFSAASRAARSRVAAAAIAALGLETDVVAGSSRQPVDLYVPGYFPGGGAQRDLGWVTRGGPPWAPRPGWRPASRGGVAALLALAVVAAAACAGGLQLMGVAGRRRDVAALRSFGWSRGQAMRWVLAEALVGAAAVLALAGAGWWLGGRSAATAAAGLPVAVAYLGCAALAGLVAVARVEQDGLAGLRAGDAWAGCPVAGRLAVRGAAGYGLRTLLARPGRTLAQAAALAVTALAARHRPRGGGLPTSRAVGPTLLASALAASTERDRWALLAIVALAGLAGTLALGRLDGRDRAGEARALRSAGWDGADLRRARLAMTAALGAAGAALAAPGAWLLAPAVPEQPSWVVVVALAVAASLVLALACCPRSGPGAAGGHAVSVGTGTAEAAAGPVGAATAVVTGDASAPGAAGRLARLPARPARTPGDRYRTPDAGRGRRGARVHRRALGFGQDEPAVDGRGLPCARQRRGALARSTHRCPGCGRHGAWTAWLPWVRVRKGMLIPTLTAAENVAIVQECGREARVGAGRGTAAPGAGGPPTGQALPIPALWRRAAAHCPRAGARGRPADAHRRRAHRASRSRRRGSRHRAARRPVRRGTGRARRLP